MRPLVVAAVALAVTIIALFAFTGLPYLSEGVGYSADDLVVPEPRTVFRSAGQVPSPITNVPQEANWAVSWEMPEDSVYEGFGGILWLTVHNYGGNDLWIYGMSFSWNGTNASYSTENGVLIGGGQDTLVGLLPFGAPLEPGNHQYELSLRIAARSANGYWYDWGDRLSAENSVEILPTPQSTGWNTEGNPIDYYDKVNQRVSVSAVEPVIAQIRDAYPGNYSVLQICEAYSWVHTNIAYVAETGGADYWQSAEETMAAKGGDCEDHAILMASIIKGLGGNARVNVIDGHAFPTVFVASNKSELAAVEASVDSYYSTPSGSLHVNYLVDDFGYWMVIDTAGEPYVGGLPALSRYASPGPWPGDWTFSNSDYLITIDATGRMPNHFPRLDLELEAPLLSW
ncbi:MAG TPA: transglutaminase family protein [Methanomassiliicoccales archaeon]|nr:transglutaminase family protein [Methanomassiliicoccales archaeon]